VQRSFRGHDITIRVENPASVSKGVRQLRLDGKVVSGNRVPVSALRDGLVVEITLG
jgi:hypothetical protein